MISATEARVAVAVGKQREIVAAAETKEHQQCVRNVGHGLIRSRMLTAFGGSIAVAGCASAPFYPVEADGTYCFRTGTRFRRRSCTLKCDWDERNATHALSGRASEVRFLQLIGSVWAFGANYRWDDSDEADARRRARQSKLIADVDLRSQR